MIKRILLGAATAILLATSHATAQQSIGGSYFVDGYGEVEQATYILASSDNQTIDASTETENFDFTGEDIEYIGAAGVLYDNGNTVDAPPAVYDYVDAYVPLSANTKVGDNYAVSGQSGACYYNYDSEGEDDCDFYTFEPFGYQLNTGLAQITSLTPNSANLGTSGSFTVNGHNLVDDFGFSTAKMYSGTSGNAAASDVSVNVQNPDPSQKNQVTVQYSINSNATVGQRNFSISTNFGESDFARFTIGYPPATITNISPSIWPAGTSFTATITGTNFGTAPTTSISAPGVTAGIATPSNGGSTITVPITVAANAPNEPVSITVQPGYTGSNFICGTACTGNGSGSTTAEVQALTPTPQIMRVTSQSNLASCQNGASMPAGTATTAVFAGEQVLLCVPAPPSGLTITNQSWSFINSQDITGGFTNTAQTGPPSAATDGTGGGQEAEYPALNGSSLKFYFLAPGANTGTGTTLNESATYTWSLDNGQSGTSKANFNVLGPTGGLWPEVEMLTTTDSTGNSNGVQVIADPRTHGTLTTTGTYDIANSGLGPKKGMVASTSAETPAGTNSYNDSANTYFTWIQVLNSTQLQTIPSTYSRASSNALDNTYPYPNDTFNSVTDTPFVGNIDTSGLGEVSDAFDATMYLMWNPGTPSGCQLETTDALLHSTASTCTSIPVPLGSFRWTWSGCAINSLEQQPSPIAITTTVFRQCGINHRYNSQATDYPVWGGTFTNIGKP